MADSWKVFIINEGEVFAENLQTHFHRCGWVEGIAGAGKSAVALGPGKFPKNGGLCVTVTSRDTPTDCASRGACTIG